MPKFTQEELEEIRRNTEEVEKARKGKKSSLKGANDGPDSKQKKKRASRKKSTTTENYSVRERLIALVLLVITVAISYLVWIGLV